MTLSENYKTDTDNFLEEWKECRDVFKTWDERLHDLRKYGFSFITALLAAQVILLPASSGDSAPNGVKFAVLIATLILIGALHCMDKGYRVFQEATMTRAKVLERRLNLELSETIANRSVRHFIRSTVVLIYGLFSLATCILGGAALTPTDPAYIVFIGCLGGVSGVVTFLPLLILPQRYENGSQDWTISPLQMNSEAFIQVTLTNLKEREGILKITAGPILSAEKKRVYFEIRREDGSEHGTTTYRGVADPAMKVLSNYTWILDKTAFNDTTGVYRLVPMTWENPRPLRRAIIFTKKDLADEKKDKTP